MRPTQSRTPTQQRSRNRQALILATAERVIAESGSDRLRMADVAERAGISIGSLYQYFPDKPAIVHALAARFNAQSRRCITSALQDVSDVHALTTSFAALMAEYYRLVGDDPAIRDVWAGMHADKVLSGLQLEESRAMSVVLADAVARVRPQADRATVAVTTLLLWDLGDAAIRLAIVSDSSTGAALVARYTRMAVRELEELCGASTLE